MSAEKKDHKVQIWVAIIGFVGVIGAAVIGNWDKLTSDKNITTQVYQKTSSEKPQKSSKDDGKSIASKIINAAYMEDIPTLKSLVTKQNVNLRGNSNGSTALMVAVWNGKLESTRLLIEQGADPFIENKGTNDSITQAICNNKIDPNIRIKNINTIVNGSLIKGDFNTSLRNSKKTILSTAAWCGNVDIVKFLLKSGANPCLDKNEVLAASKKDEVESLISDSISERGGCG